MSGCSTGATCAYKAKPLVTLTIKINVLLDGLDGQTTAPVGALTLVQTQLSKR